MREVLVWYSQYVISLYVWRDIVVMSTLLVLT